MSNLIVVHDKHEDSFRYYKKTGVQKRNFCLVSNDEHATEIENIDDAKEMVRYIKTRINKDIFEDVGIQIR